MRLSSSLFAAPFLALLASLTPTPADACSYLETDPRFMKHTAAAGGVFFVQEEIPWDSNDPRPQLPGDVMVDSDGNTYPIEIISQAGTAYAIRAPDVAPGTTLYFQNTAMATNWSYAFGEEATIAELVVTEGEPLAAEGAPTLQGVRVTTETYEYEVPVAAFPLVWESTSCGTPTGPGVYADVDESEVQIRVPGDLLNGRDIIFDAWVTQPGGSVDVENDTPDFAGYASPDERAFSPIFHDDATGEDVIAFRNYADAAESFAFHFRIRDPATGLASDLQTVSVNVPARVQSGGCSSAGDQSSLLGLALFGGLALVARRRWDA